MRDDLWSDEKIAALKRMHTEDLSYGLIASRLGIGRGAVSGKAQRLGLAKHRSGTKRPAKKFNFARPKAPPSSQRAMAAEPSSIFLSEGGSLHPSYDCDPSYKDCLTLEQLRVYEITQCRWPIGEPIRFCGRPICKRGSKSYCKHHAALAYNGRFHGLGKGFQFSTGKGNPNGKGKGTDSATGHE